MSISLKKENKNKKQIQNTHIHLNYILTGVFDDLCLTQVLWSICWISSVTAHTPRSAPRQQSFSPRWPQTSWLDQRSAWAHSNNYTRGSTLHSHPHSVELRYAGIKVFRLEVGFLARSDSPWVKRNNSKINWRQINEKRHSKYLLRFSANGGTRVLWN